MPEQPIYNVISLLKKEFKNYIWSILFLIVLSFFAGILEGVGINSIIPIFSFLNKTTPNDLISRTVSSAFRFVGLSFTLYYVLIFIIVLLVSKAILVFLINYIGVKISSNYERNTRSSLFKYTFSADWAFLSREKLGRLEQILTTDVNYSSNLLNYISSTILTVTNLIVYVLIAMNVSWLIACLTLVVGILIFIVFKPFFKKIRTISGEVEKIYKNLAHYVNEHMLGIKAIKSNNTEIYIQNRADAYFDQVKNLNIKVSFVRNFTNVLLQPIGLLFVIALFSYFYKFGSSGFNFASFAVIVYSINKMFAYIQISQTQFQIINSLVPYLFSIKNYREEAILNKEKDIGDKPFLFLSGLTCSNLSFSYTGHRDILSDISFFIKKGEMVGIIGPSGAGKTTLVDIFLRLLRPSKGKVILDSVDFQEIKLSSWREHIGYVSQDMFLLNDTIESNIKFYDQQITDAQMIEATRLANIYDFIKKQPDGFNTVVGERGIKLSGGERQRIVLSRILARQPDILILDEATSSLDNESEATVQQAIDGLKGKITVIVIAHRLSTIMAADRLIVIESGQVREEGTPEDLLQKKDSYFFKANNVRS